MHVLYVSSAKILLWVLIAAILASFSVAQTGAPRHVSHLYRTQFSTGEVVSSTWHGAQVQGAKELLGDRRSGWTLIGASVVARNGIRRLVYSDNSSGALSVSLYGGAGAETFMGSTSPVALEGGWKGRAVADIDGDGNLDVIADHEGTGQVAVYFFGGFQGTSLLRHETISSLSAPGWTVVGAADLNRDGRPDLLLQDCSTRQVMVAYLAESNGIDVTATQVLSGTDFRGWTAAGMQDMNGDGHPDLILTNDTTGETTVNYYGGDLGVAFLRSDSVDPSVSPDWKLVVPAATTNETKTIDAAITDLVESASLAPDSTSTLKTEATTFTTTSTATTTTSTLTAPVLIFNGTGTSSTAVTAIANVVHSLGFAYHTVNSSQLDSMTQAKLASYRLFIVPGGNSITIGKYLTSKATTTVRSAISENGLNYLGMCAGGFFGGYSSYYKVLNLTSGVWFKFFADYYKGIHKESVKISFPSRSRLDIYWQNGPALSGWGKVVGKYPNGQPAITEGYRGKGFVILSGVHPEAPASWRTGMQFDTPVDVDLAYARTLVRAAMNRTMLPHF